MRNWRRPSASFALSIVLHILVGAGILRLLLMPHPGSNWLRPLQGKQPVVERIGFVAVPQNSTETNPGKSGGDNRRVTNTHPKPLVAPQAVPSALPTAPTTPSAAPVDAGAGPVVGAGGATEGVAPKYNDKRVWVGAAPVVTAPKTVPEQMNAAVAAAVKAHNDSLMAMGSERTPGDWTFGKGDNKWGIDPKYIRLGPVSIPTALLGILPLNVTGNPVTSMREAQLTAMHQDIQFHANQAINEDQFRQAVKELRQRKERERQQQLHPDKPAQEKEPTLASDGSSSQPVIPQP